MATIFISAGEASGERYGALLIESLRNEPLVKALMDLMGAQIVKVE